LKWRNVVLKRGLARRVVFDGMRATGVEIERGGRLEIVTARREVILAASSINSPKLLMLSGVGPGPHLAELGIEVRAHRPGVGANLQDHLELYVQQTCLQPITLYSKLNLVSKAWIGLRWMLLKSGDGATNHFESAAFVRSRAGVKYPDIQYHFLPVAIRYDGKAPAMRSESRGSVTLRSADPLEAPVIRFNYLSHEQDRHDFRHCIRLTRELFSQPAFRPYAGDEISPGAAVRSDDELDDFVRRQVESAYHPCGTCRMGRADDPDAVVDPDCRVIGVESLRVVDSSILPRITNGNLNGPSILVGEKAADHILGRRLAADPRQPWINPRWRESDR
jgi:choline dehydrogenase